MTDKSLSNIIRNHLSDIDDLEHLDVSCYARIQTSQFFM